MFIRRQRLYCRFAPIGPEEKEEKEDDEFRVKTCCGGQPVLLREGQLFAGTTWRSILKSKKLSCCLLENPSKDDEMREACNWLRLSGLVCEVAASIVDVKASTNQMKMAIYLPSQAVLPVLLEEDTDVCDDKETQALVPTACMEEQLQSVCRQ